MAKAVYSTDNIGHYGLGFKEYTHFTSPIRRFPDLIVHQLLENYMRNQKTGVSKNKLQKICEHSSFRERNAVSAERISIKIKQIDFLKDRIGETYHGIISGVMNFGIFVELCDTLAEGLVHIRNLRDDYYTYDEKNYMLVGKNSGRKYRLGDKVEVKLINVNQEKREIDFALLDI